MRFHFRNGSDPLFYSVSLIPVGLTESLTFHGTEFSLWDCRPKKIFSRNFAQRSVYSFRMVDLHFLIDATRPYGDLGGSRCCCVLARNDLLVLEPRYGDRKHEGVLCDIGIFNVEIDGERNTVENLSVYHTFSFNTQMVLTYVGSLKRSEFCVAETGSASRSGHCDVFYNLTNSCESFFKIALFCHSGYSVSRDPGTKRMVLEREPLHKTSSFPDNFLNDIVEALFDHICFSPEISAIVPVDGSRVPINIFSWETKFSFPRQVAVFNADSSKNFTFAVKNRLFA